MDILIENANEIVQEFVKEPLMQLYFKHCYGIVILSAVEGALVLSGQSGSGLLLRHDKDKMNEWSPPCAIRLAGVGAGIHVGLGKKHIIMFLTEKTMVKTLTGEFQLRIGHKISLSTSNSDYNHGLEDETIVWHFSNKGTSSTFSFAHTKGYSIGISLEGGIITPKNKTNESYYGEKVSPQQILYGRVKTPKDEEEKEQGENGKLQSLYDCLNEARKLYDMPAHKKNNNSSSNNNNDTKDNKKKTHASLGASINAIE